MAHYDKLKDADGKDVVKADGVYFAAKVTLRSDTGRIVKRIRQPQTRIGRTDGSGNITYALQVVEPVTVKVGENEDGDIFALPGYTVKESLSVPSDTDKRTHNGYTVLPIMHTTPDGRADVLRLTEKEMTVLGNDGYTVRLALEYGERAYPLTDKRTGTREKAGEESLIFETRLDNQQAFGCLFSVKGTVTESLFRLKAGEPRKGDTFGSNAGEPSEPEYEDVTGKDKMPTGEEVGTK